MVTTNKLAEVAAVMGDPVRAAMLGALMDGRALTARELASVAGITPQTASTHLAKLSGADFLKVEMQGRHRYHRIASPAVARMIETLMQHASHIGAELQRPNTGPRADAMRRARTCYDHLAGRLGVAIADVLVAQGHVEIETDVGLITRRGAAFFTKVGIASSAPSGKRPSSRPLCRACLDWSERRMHLSGHLGAAICRHGFDQGWLRRINHTRALDITPKGRLALKTVFGLDPAVLD